jgi:hypothetical protein
MVIRRRAASCRGAWVDRERTAIEAADPSRLGEAFRFSA